MNIDQHTRISELIKANEASIEAIAGLAKPLRKLKNPLLRKVMASRVTLAEAAEMGGCQLSDFKRVLEPLGFHFVEVTSDKAYASLTTSERPPWLPASGQGQAEYFDVRAVIAAGNDPLTDIVKRYGTLRKGQALCIVNSFIPYPLIHLLEKKGAQSYVELCDNDVYHTWFLKEREISPSGHTSASGSVNMHDADSFRVLMDAHVGFPMRHIDVRPLPMPQPMQAILEELETLGEKEMLYVQHKRVPLHLLEELDGQRYAIHIHEVKEGDVKLLIVNQAS